MADLQAEVNEQENAAELSHVIEEQHEQLDQLRKERDDVREKLEASRRDVTFAPI